eukprot:CAMPEP_0184646600 /NCGR_PEP_ID=MMETSP0308-20130426/3305_1 /TAXON_ID=38269 /ORGANISM="Gloeochaete witrockiana, Strain SAG 46.84" /LENGTH=407 /DNA_ID=CAMNT_0027076775 /DNA_START=1 /DNA_END=1224 /DNA_ORIENTATION=-
MSSHALLSPFPRWPSSRQCSSKHIGFLSVRITASVFCRNESPNFVCASAVVLWTRARYSVAAAGSLLNSTSHSAPRQKFVLQAIVGDDIDVFNYGRKRASRNDLRGRKHSQDFILRDHFGSSLYRPFGVDLRPYIDRPLPIHVEANFRGRARETLSERGQAVPDGIISANSASKTSRPRVVFFDLDRTLIDCNSANLWLVHEIRNGNVSVADAARGAYWLIKYRLGHGGAEKPYQDAVSRLTGQSEAELSARAQKWFMSRVIPRLRPGAAEAIRAHREAGDRLVLATSGTTYAADSAIQNFGLDDYVCTRFEVVDGRFTGKIASFAYGVAKAHRVQEWADENEVDLKESVFYTDSVTDLDLLEMVGYPVIVNPDGPLRRIARERNWPIVDWGRTFVGKRRFRRRQRM